jgi:hypothetical protein
MKPRHARGAASVELAVSMIFLVPLIMYMMFLQDMLIMKLNGQEAAVQASWDFATLEYGSAVEADAIARFSRLTYCDHTSAYDSYNIQYDCSDQIHHKAMTAHECWIGQNPSGFVGQVRCGISEKLSPSGDGPRAVAGYGQGGVVTCSSRLGIMNYYLPNKFLTTFRKGKGFAVNDYSSEGGGGSNAKKRMQSRWAVGNGSAASQDKAHTDKDGATPQGDKSQGSNYWRLAKTQHAMLVDPWGLGLQGGKNDIATIQPQIPSAFNLTHPLYARINSAYKAVGKDAIDAAENWNKSIEGDFIQGNSRQDGQGDNLSTPATAFKKHSAEQEFPGGNHSSSAWTDPRVKSTNGSRQSGYFGLKE